MEDVYEPMEDSELLAKWAAKCSKGIVLDMGTGSGVQAIAAARNAEIVLGVDVSRKAVEEARKNAVDAGIRNAFFFESDLFSFFDMLKEKRNFSKIAKVINDKRIACFLSGEPAFDVILFNPPYLPHDKGIEDRSLYGGAKGHETVERFMDSVSGFLKKEGIILIVFSSITGLERVEGIFSEHCFDFKRIDERKIFFESLYVYELRKSELLKKFEEKGIKGVKIIAKGHRGIVWRGKLKNIFVAVKSKREDSKAVDRIENEAKWLKVMNKHGIGPKLILEGNGFFAMELVEGELICDFIEKSSRERALWALREALLQARKMDAVGVNKEEMHYPVKHIFVSERVVMIDFERCRNTERPKNVTQLCQFIGSDKVMGMLRDKGFSLDREILRGLAGEYRKNMCDESFERILGALR